MKRALVALNLVVLAALVVVFAFVPQHAGVLTLQRFTYVAIYFIALLGLNVLVGYSGQISLGHFAFVGVGAYTSALLILGRPGLALFQHHPPVWLPIGDGMRAIFTIPIAGLVAGIVGYAFGLPAQRLAGVSLALATFAVAVSMPQLAKHFENVTGGAPGLPLTLPTTPFGWHIAVPHWLYYQAWVTAAILAAVAWLFLRGRAGRALGALRDGEIAAVSSGINPTAYKTFAFGISAGYAGVAGALFVIEISFVNPDTFPVDRSIILLASLVLGGLGSTYGALIGAFAMEYLPIYAQNPPFVSGNLSNSAPPVTFGVILVVLMFVAPTGLMGLLRRLGRRIIQSLDTRSVGDDERTPLGKSRRAEA
jgi:branched-chain amino acid transport system permease protein